MMVLRQAFGKAVEGILSRSWFRMGFPTHGVFLLVEWDKGMLFRMGSYILDSLRIYISYIFNLQFSSLPKLLITGGGIIERISLIYITATTVIDDSHHLFLYVSM